MAKEVAEKLWEYVTKKYPEDAKTIEEIADEIPDDVFYDKKSNEEYCAILKLLYEEYRLVNGNEIVSKEGKRYIKWRYLKQEEIATLMGVKRTTLSQHLNGSRFMNGDDRDQIYTRTRRLYLKIFSLFFKVSPRYLAGLQPERDYLVDGKISLMVFSNNEFEMGIQVFYAKLSKSTDKEQLKRYLDVLKSIKCLEKLKDEHEALQILRILFLFPEVNNNKNAVLPSDEKTIKKEKTEYYYKWGYIDEKGYLGFALNEICNHVGAYSPRLLYELGKLFYQDKLVLLKSFLDAISESGIFVD